MTNNEPVYVSDYGAIGDGIHDDTEAMQRAIDAASPEQGVWLDGWNTESVRGGGNTSGKYRMGGENTMDEHEESVRDAGAIGDGVHNDGPEIQAVIDATNGYFSSAFVPSGKYRIERPLVIINKRGFRLHGETKQIGIDDQGEPILIPLATIAGTCPGQPMLVAYSNIGLTIEHLIWVPALEPCNLVARVGRWFRKILRMPAPRTSTGPIWDLREKE